MRRTGPPEGLPVVCVNGGSAAVVPGDWSASMEWLVERHAGVLRREAPDEPLHRRAPVTRHDRR